MLLQMISLLLGYISALARCVYSYDGAAWSVGLSVCQSMTTASPAEMAEPNDVPFDVDSGGPEEPCIRWQSTSPYMNGQF